MSFAKSFMDKIDSGTSVFWVYLTGDEGRAERALRQITEDYKTTTGTDLRWYSWNVCAGASWNSKCKDPVQALLEVRDKVPGHGLVLMKDLGTFLNGAGPKNLELRRQLAELCIANSLSNDKRTRPICIIANTPTPHPDIAEFCDVIDFELPHFAEMEVDVVDFILGSVSSDKAANKTCTPALKEKITWALLGTTAEEALRIFAYAISTSGGVNESVLEVIAAEKAKVIRKIEGLRYIPYAKIPDVDKIGGFRQFIVWLKKRARAYTKHAKEVGMEIPRGAVLIGPPGCGKTFVAKAAAKILGLDLILLDIGSLFDKFVGGSEAKVRAAMQMVDAMPNALLCVDELDKSFGGAHENQAADSGVASRVLSYFLNWLVERDVSSNTENRVFVLATLNRTAGVPPELLRAGRFDRVWSVDLPDKDERAEILSIHLNKRGVPSKAYGKSLMSVVSATDAFTGAELEEVVISARNDAYDARMATWESEGKKGDAPNTTQIQPTVEELLTAASEITPVAKLDSESIAAIRKFCAESCYPVNGERVQDTTRSRSNRKVSTARGDVSVN
jgi:SpoVK/Ycf46/Vps4 family AAA+-type ATPase